MGLFTFRYSGFVDVLNIFTNFGMADDVRTLDKVPDEKVICTESSSEHVRSIPSVTSASHPVPTGEEDKTGNHQFCRRQLSRHLNMKKKTDSKDKMVQTLISGNFFVNTANVYAGKLVE